MQWAEVEAVGSPAKLQGIQIYASNVYTLCNDGCLGLPVDLDGTCSTVEPSLLHTRK